VKGRNLRETCKGDSVGERSAWSSRRGKEYQTESDLSATLRKKDDGGQKGSRTERKDPSGPYNRGGVNGAK